MARNEEKSHSMLNRWLQLERGGPPKEKVKRPYLVELCHDIQDAQRWRLQVLREIGKNVLAIQNASLEEHKLRDLNDSINKLLREKQHWERRIKELGGQANYAGPPIAESEDDEGAIRAPGGYYYFGAAKNLPGVRELLKPKKRDQTKRTRHELYQRIDVDYYGYRDDEDGLLEALEAKAEEQARADAIEIWNETAVEKYGSLEAAPNLPSKSAKLVEEWKSYVALPSQEEIEQEILRRRKEELMKKYLS